MDKLDLKFYWSVFMRRQPHFLVVLALLSAIGITVATILPPVYRSGASMLVEPQQIPDELAQTTVPVNPYEQVQIIEQRLMTRANLIALADRIGLYVDEPELSIGARVTDMRERIEFLGFEPDPTRGPTVPGATIIGVAFNAPTPEFANKGANELVNLVLEENVKLRTSRADDTLQFFEAEVSRLQGELKRKAEAITEFKTANFEALPDSLAARRQRQLLEQERLLALEREEAALRNQRATVVWVFERTGNTTLAAQSPEEEQLETLKSEMLQQSAIYAPSSPRIRLLASQIAALESLVEKQRAERAVPDANGQPAAPASSLDVELAPIDARLAFIAQDKAAIEKTLADLDTSIQTTPKNEMILAGLDRELENLNNQYNAAVASLGQAKVGERIEVLSKGERFSLIEQPTIPGSPVRPKRLLIASAGIVGGLGAGLGFVVLLEMLNRSIRRPLDLSEKLGLEPFATIPYIRTVGETRRKRSLVVLALVLVAVAIPAVLLAVHTLYLPLDLVFSELLAKVGLGADVPAS